MFQELKLKITQENVEKIRKNQRLIEIGEQLSKDQRSQSVSSDGELTQRLQIFKMLIQERPNNKLTSKKAKELRDDGHYEQKLNLNQQRMKIEKELHQKELQLLLTKQENEREAFKAEIEKLKCIIERQVKEEGVISRLKKENRQLQQLHTRSQQISQNLLLENAQLKKQITKLKCTIKQKQEKEAYLQAKQHIESQSQTRLKEQVLIYEKQKQTHTQRKKQLQQLVNKLKSENQELIREIDRHKMESSFEKTQISQKFMLKLSEAEQQKAELKKRNQKLQQSFIQHLTQTSLNLQQTLKVAPERASKNSTIYLQQSPIKTRSRSRQQVRMLPEQQDPEKVSAKHCNCSGQLNRLKAKLQQANSKIVQLLYQKCQMYGRR